MAHVRHEVVAVEPIILPFLVGVRKRQLEVLGLGLQLDDCSTADGEVGVARMLLHHEQLPPEAKVGPSPQEALTERDETRNV